MENHSTDCFTELRADQMLGNFFGSGAESFGAITFNSTTIAEKTLMKRLIRRNLSSEGAD
jgi:hypothetical protein